MLNVDPQDAVYVGDMQVDYWAAERAGIDFINGSFTLRWAKIAPTINIPIKNADGSIRKGNHMPAISNVAKVNFEKPMIFINQLLNP